MRDWCIDNRALSPHAEVIAYLAIIGFMPNSGQSDPFYLLEEVPFVNILCLGVILFFSLLTPKVDQLKVIPPTVIDVTIAWSFHLCVCCVSQTCAPC